MSYKNNRTLVKVYSSKSELSNPVTLIRSMYRDVCMSRDLAYRLAVRDITSKYRQSALGIVWAFLPPLLTTVIFLLLTKSNVIALPYASSTPYVVYVLIGVLLWQLFTDSINTPLRIINQNKSMLSKLSFPKEALIISGIYQILFDFFIKILILSALIIYYKLNLSFGAVFFFLMAAFIIMLGTVIGMLLVPPGMLFDDIASGLPFVTSLWFFLTPVAYTIPENGLLHRLMNLNPVSHLIIAGRDAILIGRITNWNNILMVSSLCFLSLFFVWILYRLALTVLLERI